MNHKVVAVALSRDPGCPGCLAPNASGVHYPHDVIALCECGESCGTTGRHTFLVFVANDRATLDIPFHWMLNGETHLIENVMGVEVLSVDDLMARSLPTMAARA